MRVGNWVYLLTICTVLFIHGAGTKFSKHPILSIAKWLFYIKGSSFRLAISSMATTLSQPLYENVTSQDRSFERFGCHRYKHTRLHLEPCTFDDDDDLLMSLHFRILEQWKWDLCPRPFLAVSKSNNRTRSES